MATLLVLKFDTPDGAAKALAQLQTLQGRHLIEIQDVKIQDADMVEWRQGKPETVMIRYEDYVAMQDELTRLRAQDADVYQVMLASEQVLRQEWDTPEEDAAWADL